MSASASTWTGTRPCRCPLSPLLIQLIYNQCSMSLSFAHVWKQQESSDMDIILLAPARAAAQSGRQQEQQQDEVAARPALVELARLPAHSILLSNSAVLWCRVQRWQGQGQDEGPTTRAIKRARISSSNNNSVEQYTRGRLELELQDPSEQEAALAVLQSLYAVKPLPELLSELSQEQQLQAAVLADMWQVPHVSSAAAQLLAAAASTPGALAEAVQQRVLSAEALPDCLQPLLKSVLLSLFGDLEAVWADAGLREELLWLPLPAMELLLSCNELKVASEDTVLYTARQYISNLEDEQYDQAQQQLARVIRCPHLSRFWLSGSVNSADAGDMLLAELQPQLRQLLLLRDAQEDYNVEAADLQEGGWLAGAPSRWALGRRASKPVSSVQLEWQLDVSELRDAAHRSAAKQGCVRLLSPEVSPPLGGISFGMQLACRFVDAGTSTGVKLGLYFGPKNLLGDMSCICTFRVGVTDFQAYTITLRKPGRRKMTGWADHFEVGLMAGGWDEVAWAGKGLPTSGQLTIKLTVSGLPHAPMPRAPVGRGRHRVPPVLL